MLSLRLTKQQFVNRILARFAHWRLKFPVVFYDEQHVREHEEVEYDIMHAEGCILVDKNALLELQKKRRKCVKIEELLREV